MVPHGHRRQVLLFLVAILLPCVVLVALGLRILEQERELGVKRLADERRAIAAQVRRDLSTRLDRMALQEATTLLADPASPSPHTYRNPAVALVAAVDHGRLSLPWERDPRPARFGHLLAQPNFGQLVTQGERTEMAGARPGEAVGIYGEAMAAATDAAQAVYARLLRARARLAAGQRAQALRDYRAVLGPGVDIVDEHGVPLALYAATRVLQVGGDTTGVRDVVRACLGADRWLSPTALYMLRDLVGGGWSSADSTDSTAGHQQTAQQEAVAARIAATEQALALQRDFSHLSLGVDAGPFNNGESSWIPYGAPTWLVGLATPFPEGDSQVVVAVRADTLFAIVQRSYEDGGPSVSLAIASGDDDGEPLGAGLPGVVAHFASSTAAGPGVGGARRWFYGVALLFVLGITLLGAYFVSRDVRRELRLAEVRSRFVSAVSHELKTPLTAIRMFAETLQLGGASDPDTQSEYLDTIVHESERLTRLLNNVLDFSRIERGRKEYRLTPNDLAEIVSASARAMQYPLEQQHFTLDVQTQDELPPLDVDPDAVEQAILNLLSNAMKYSGDSREITLRLVRTDGDAVIEVSDGGVGIAPEEQRKIFQQFYRVPSGKNDGVPGTGLGLTLVQHIAEGHGGRVTVRSAVGQGSTFAIHLPLERTAP